jgi:hypothetical protein
MKRIIIIAFCLITSVCNAQLKDPTKLKVTQEFSDTVRNKSLKQLQSYYKQYKEVKDTYILSSTVLTIYLDKFFIIAVVRTDYIQLNYYPNDELCEL